MNKKNNNLKILFKCFLFINRFSRHIIFFQILKSIADAFLPFIGMYMSTKIIDNIINGGDPNQTFAYAMITVGTGLITKVISIILSRFINIKQLELTNNYEKSKSMKVSTMDYSEIENPATKNLLNRIRQYEELNNGGLMSIFTCVNSLLNNFFTMLFSVLLTLSMFILPYSYNTSLIDKIIVNPFTGILILLLIIIYVIFNGKAGIKCTKYENEEYSKFTFINNLSSELTSHIYSPKSAMDIRIYGQTDSIMQHCHETMALSYEINGKTNAFFLKKLIIPGELLRLFIQFLIYVFSVVSAVTGRFSAGSITKYIAALASFSESIKQLANTYESLRYNCELSKYYFDFMDKPSEMSGGSDLLDIDDNYSFEFRNVSFKYIGSDVYAIKNLNCVINKHSRLAIVGMNGSGKTTLIKLLCRLYDPTDGEILLNGKNIKDYNYKEYLKIFSVIFQDYTLFSMPIANNVAANEIYDETRVVSCLEKSGFAERLHSLENTIYTPLYQDFDKNGVMISGGEAQKIAIARAMYRDAPVYIFDEPTAALDPISEVEIYTRLNQIVKDKTVIFISHRLSSCVFSDEIIVMDNGIMVQRGTHRTLLEAKSGKYFELWNAQAQYYE